MSHPTVSLPAEISSRHARGVDIALAAATVGIGSILILGSPEEFDTGWPEVAAGVGAFVLVALRRRWPVGLLAVAVVWTAIHVAVLERPSLMIFASLVLLASAAMRVDRWPAIGLGIVVGATLYAAALVTNDFSFGDPRSVIALAWTAVAVGIGDATRSWRRYRESAEAQVRSAVLAAEAETRQQISEERLSMARELHDLLAHNLSVMNVQTGAAQHLLRSDPDGAEAALSAAREAGREVLDELRELLSVLRHDDTGNGAPRSALPTVDDISTLVDRMRAAGLQVLWNQTGAPRDIAPAVSLAAYRIVQEGLTNAAKHGDGSAELATVWDTHGLAIGISNPVPAEKATDTDTVGGHGLVGMRERAVGNGGTFEAAVKDGRFVVSANLPVPAPRTELTQ